MTGMIKGFFWVRNFHFQVFFLGGGGGRKIWQVFFGVAVPTYPSHVVILHNVIVETEDVHGCLECC